MYHSDSGRRFDSWYAQETAKMPHEYFRVGQGGHRGRETYKVPQNEADCTNKHLSAIWMLSSYRPPSSANVGINTNAQRRIRMVWVVLNILSKQDE